MLVRDFRHFLDFLEKSFKPSTKLKKMRISLKKTGDDREEQREKNVSSRFRTFFHFPEKSSQQPDK